MTPPQDGVTGEPPERVDGPCVVPPLTGMPCGPMEHLARPLVISLDGVFGCPRECVAWLSEVYLDGGGGGDAGPRFGGLPEPRGGPRLIPPPGASSGG